jgi:hypothetical protein
VAVTFELVVNFGLDEVAVLHASSVARAAGQIVVRDVVLPLGRPAVTRIGGPQPYFEFAVHPTGLGTGVQDVRRDFDPRSRTTVDITRAGQALYSLLRQLSGYRAAIVGWDPESLIDVNDLEADSANGDPPEYDGVVLDRRGGAGSRNWAGCS